MHDAEDGRVRADAESERQQDDGRVAAMAEEAADAEAEILAERVDGAESPRIAALVLDLREAAEAPARLGARLGGREAAPDAGVGLELEMVAELGLHLVFEGRGPHGAAQAADERRERRHGTPSPSAPAFPPRGRAARQACCSTRATAAVTRSQVAVSSASCVRPVRVSR